MARLFRLGWAQKRGPGGNALLDLFVDRLGADAEALELVPRLSPTALSCRRRRLGSSTVARMRTHRVHPPVQQPVVQAETAPQGLERTSKAGLTQQLPASSAPAELGFVKDRERQAPRSLSAAVFATWLGAAIAIGAAASPPAFAAEVGARAPVTAGATLPRETIDLGSIPAPQLLRALERAIDDPAFAEKAGGAGAVRRMKNADLARQAAFAIVSLRDPAGPDVYAGGVQFGGKAIQDAERAMPFTPLVTLPSDVTAQEILLAFVKLDRLQAGHDEAALRGAIAGEPAPFLSGQRPKEGTFIFGARQEAGGSTQVGIAFDPAKLRLYQDQPADPVKIGAYLRERFVQLDGQQ